VHVLVTGGSGLVGRYVVDALAANHRVTVADLRTPHRNDITYIKADVQDLPGLTKALEGAEAVVHLAGIPHPLNDPPEKVFHVNAIGTFNALEACARNHIRRFVFMSSESTLGFAFAKTRLAPLYLPIDEDHVLRPQDPYGLSKLTGELLCRGYSDRFAVETICLRAPWIWVPEDKERAFYQQLIAEYPHWYKNLWACVHVYDVARAVALAISTTVERAHDVFFITSDENWTGRESKHLAAEYYPETRDVRPEFQGTCSFITSKKARQRLNYVPEYRASDIFH